MPDINKIKPVVDTLDMKHFEPNDVLISQIEMNREFIERILDKGEPKSSESNQKGNNDD